MGFVIGWSLLARVRRILAHGSWLKSALIGPLLALVVWELAITLLLVALPDDGILPPLALAWAFGPLLVLPVILTAGPLSGLSLLAVYRRLRSWQTAGRPSGEES